MLTCHGEESYEEEERQRRQGLFGERRGMRDCRGKIMKVQKEGLRNLGKRVMREIIDLGYVWRTS